MVHPLLECHPQLNGVAIDVQVPFDCFEVVEHHIELVRILQSTHLAFVRAIPCNVIEVVVLKHVIGKAGTVDDVVLHQTHSSILQMIQTILDAPTICYHEV